MDGGWRCSCTPVEESVKVQSRSANTTRTRVHLLSSSVGARAIRIHTHTHTHELCRLAAVPVSQNCKQHNPTTPFPLLSELTLRPSLHIMQLEEYDAATQQLECEFLRKPLETVIMLYSYDT